MLNARYAVFNIATRIITALCNECKLYNCFVIKEDTTKEESTSTAKREKLTTKKTKSGRIIKPIQRLSYAHIGKIAKFYRNTTPAKKEQPWASNMPDGQRREP